ncbi:MAG: type 2 isopentenyl-diphosphate Delta-isomerase [Bacteroidetes bacterium]|nr:type 2 isopentenyl-diphosphate Delta-isomerase [Bacteroidota bacterium]
MKNNIDEIRKSQHIKLALNSQILENDTRFYYEPALNCNIDSVDLSVNFLNSKFNAPIWISSMTGGTENAGKINKNLANACKKYRFGMGLGSCRQIIDSNEHLEDFALRKITGDDVLIFANLGIAQVEQLVSEVKINKINELIDKTETNGLIIHINPLQEWLQPEGDKIKTSPINTISEILNKTNINLIVKEVGQGMGPESLLNLMKMPLRAIEFGALGGTNFSKIEISRNEKILKNEFSSVASIGHTAVEMIDFINDILKQNKNIKCKNFIISGGVKGFLDGYYLINKINANAIYAQASGFLQYAMKDFESLCYFIESQLEGLKMAKTLLKCRV